MKRRSLTNFLLVSALMLSGATTFVSCKDYDSDAAYDMNEQWNKKFAEIVAEQQKKLDEINRKLEQIKSCGCTDQAVIDLINKQIKENKTTIDAINSNVEKYIIEQLLIDNSKLNNAITNSESVHKLLVEIYGEDGTSGMKRLLDDLNTDFTDSKAAWTEKMSDLSDSVKWALTLAQTDSIRLDKIDKLIKNNTDSIAKLRDEYDKLFNTTIPSLSKDINDAKEDIKKAQAAADSALAKAKDLDKALTDSIANVRTEILKEVADKYATKDDIKNLITLEDVKTWYENSGIDDRLTTLENNYKSLIATLDYSFNNLVTGVIMQGSESPLTGYVSTPFGVSVNVLGAYYGTGADNFDLGDFTSRKSTLISDAAANAGLIFINVNPVNVNPSGITFTLVDSQGNEAPFKLTPVNTNRILKFGGTRAVTNSNGFYALQVKLDEDKIKAAQTWTSADASDLKAAAKNVLDKLRHPKTSALNVGDIVSSVESVFNNRLTRYAVKATWNIKNSNGDIVEKSTVSQLNLAATAVKPLSYRFLENGVSIDLPRIPSLQEKLHFTDYKFNWTPIEGIGNVKTSVTIKGMPDLDNITIDGSVVVPDITIGGENGSKITITTKDGKTELEGTVVKDADGKDHVIFDLSQLDATTTVKIGDIKVDKDNIKITIPKVPEGEEEAYDVEIPMDEFNKIIDNINKQVENMVGNVNDIVDRVDGWTESIDGQIINRVNSYIKRFENLLKNSNSLLQPTMLYTAQSGAWNQLPNVSEAAAYLKLNGGKASTVFIATSYTAELLAPAYKKYVHVTSAPAGATVTGNNLGKVIDGNVYKIGFEANKPGTYEITYEAVDYAGKTVKKTFYVKVVE